MTKARTLADNFAADINAITASTPLTGGGTSGTVTVSIQDGTTSQKGAVQLEDSTASTSITKASTPNSVKLAYDLANGAIAKSLVDAKGDLLVGSANDTVSRLTVASTAGYLLTVDSAEATGLKWAAPAGGGGGGGLTLLETLSLSGTVNSVTSSTISGSYKNLVILGVNVSCGSGNLDGTYRFNGDSGSNYIISGVSGQDSSASGEGSAGTSFPFPTVSVDNNFNGMQVLTVFRYTDTTRRLVTMFGNGNISTGGNTRYRFLTGHYKGSSAITSLTFARAQTDQSFATGNIYIYGVN